MLNILYLAAAHLSILQSTPSTIDLPLEMRLEGLPPSEIVVLEAKALDDKSEVWTSQTYFRVGPSGIVDLKQAPPLPGSSYEIADEMGPFWSMLPTSGDPSATFKCQEDLFTVEFTLRQGKEVLCRETVTRFLKSPEVQRIEIREEGIVGTLFLPSSEKPLPVIITLSGSNGGISEPRAKLLSSHGFAVLALGVFGVEGLPPRLEEIPLEYFETTFSWLKKQPRLDASRIGLYGISRGGELALLVASHFPESVQAVAAVVPSSVVYGGSNEAPIHAWLYRGEPLLPFAPVSQPTVEKGSADQPVATRESFIEGMKDKQPFEAAAIPVEKICCPLLLVSAGDDQMWPSDLFAVQILDRLEREGSSIPRLHLHYPDAGHGINIPNLPTPSPTYYHPVAEQWFSLGGTRGADAAASRDAWAHLVPFFEQALLDDRQ